ncbi:hypothetical protein DICVIV_02052 [Dictyocaulus viviparus]|uniref:SXP/RAL-2 family protein Ani s 5-like cation-binding domain-containing protein n=1 Tax=Dictyocaulus viviparus TaxID=29172 RepID=A0A0D8YB20_DICVI|nr:hypothetical protein DICVIV_02052 [Dictyocaulus viviparus]
MTQMLAFILLLFAAIAVATTQSTTIPRLPKEIPPGFEKLLPSDVVRQLKEVHENDLLTAEEQHQRIDEIMVSLPEDVLDRLPPPPGFERLPLSIRNELKKIHRDKGINWRQRHEKIRSLVSELWSIRPAQVQKTVKPTTDTAIDRFV